MRNYLLMGIIVALIDLDGAIAVACDHCPGRCVTCRSALSCPPCPPPQRFAGYYPTCWQRWPAPWGCPTAPPSEPVRRQTPSEQTKPPSEPPPAQSPEQTEPPSEQLPPQQPPEQTEPPKISPEGASNVTQAEPAGSALRERNGTSWSGARALLTAGRRPYRPALSMRSASINRWAISRMVRR